MVLVVEDDVLTAAYLEEVLADMGFEVSLAYNLAAGFAWLLLKAPRLAILDVNLGRDLVFPLAAELRAREIPIVFSTGCEPRDFPSEWLNYPIVPKPLAIETLISALSGIDFELPR
jgi:DNA-binding response OmpR family regulator